MNAERRAAITALMPRIEELVNGVLAEIKSEVETLATDERDVFDSIPEGLQGSERGQAMEAAADALDEAVSEFESAVTSLENVVSNLDQAGGE